MAAAIVKLGATLIALSANGLLAQVLLTLVLLILLHPLLQPPLALVLSEQEWKHGAVIVQEVALIKTNVDNTLFIATGLLLALLLTLQLPSLVQATVIHMEPVTQPPELVHVVRDGQVQIAQLLLVPTIVIITDPAQEEFAFVMEDTPEMIVVLLQCLLVPIHALVKVHVTLLLEFALAMLDFQELIAVLLHHHLLIPPLTLLPLQLIT